jgi:hypothetical protein
LIWAYRPENTDDSGLTGVREGRVRGEIELSPRLLVTGGGVCERGMSTDWKSAALAGMGSLVFLLLGLWMSRVDESKDQVPELRARMVSVEVSNRDLASAVAALGKSVGELSGEIRSMRVEREGREGR